MGRGRTALLVVVMLAAAACQRTAGVAVAPAGSPSVTKPASPTTSASGPSTKLRLGALAATSNTLWVLGTVGCTANKCPAHLYRSRDDGRRWQQLPLPPAVTMSSGDGTTPGVTNVAFATDEEGLLYGPALWSTHDGGATWHRLRVAGAVTAVRFSATVTWAVSQSCASGQACRGRVLRAATGTDQFRDAQLPQPSGADGAPVSIATNGSVVGALVSGTPNTRHDADQLDLSIDDGRTWTHREGPCLNELGGSLAVSRSTVWSACPTGMQAAIAVSQNRDAFHEQRGPWQALPNSAGVTVGAHSVLVTSAGSAWVSKDSGASWSVARVITPAWQSLADISFPAASEGYALAVAPTTSWLVHTTDGGHTWKRLPPPTA